MSQLMLERRVATLERKVHQLEARLGQGPELSPMELEASAAELADTSVLPAVPDTLQLDEGAADPVLLRQPALPPPLPVVERANRDGVEVDHYAGLFSDAASLPADQGPAVSDQPVTRDADAQQNSQKSKDAWQLESLIGGRWYAIAGALAVVVGAGLFLKLAVENGWFAMPPAMKCLAAGAFGAMLIGAGEILRRRISAAAATGAFAAGLGVMYATAFASYQMYGLISDSTAFVLMGFVAVMGIGISALVRLPAVGVIALVGGYLTPFLFADASDRQMVLPAYLVTLLVIGLSMPALRGAAFASHRTLVRTATLLIGGFWGIATVSANPLLVLMFSIIVWLLYHAEISWSALREQLVGQGEVETDEFAPVDRRSWRAWSPIAATFSVTAWACFLGVTVMLRSQVGNQWIIPAAYFVATSMLGLIFAGHLDAFRMRPRTDRERIGAVFHVQAATLLIVTVALFVGGATQVMAWLAMSVAAVIAGNILRSRVFHAYALVVICICTLRLLTLDLLDASLTRAVLTFLGFELSYWTMLAAATGIAWCLNAGAMLSARVSAASGERSTRRWGSIADGASVVGIALLTLSLALAAPDWFSRSLVIAGGAALAWCWAAAWLRPQLDSFGDLALVCSGIFAARSLSLESAGGTDLAGLVLTRSAFLVATLAAAFFLRAWRRGPSQATAANALATVGAIALLLSPLHERAQSSSILFVWITFAFAIACLPARVMGVVTNIISTLAMALCVALWSSTFLAGHWVLTGLGSGLSLVALCLFIPRMTAYQRGETLTPVVRSSYASIASVLLLIVTSFQVASTASSLASDESVKAAAVSIWWGIFAIALIIGGFVRALPMLRHAGLLLLAVGAVKGLVIDQWDAPAVWRICSFILLGLMMIAVAAGYQKVMRLHQIKAVD